MRSLALLNERSRTWGRLDALPSITPRAGRRALALKPDMVHSVWGFERFKLSVGPFYTYVWHECQNTSSHALALNLQRAPYTNSALRLCTSRCTPIAVCLSVQQYLVTGIRYLESRIWNLVSCILYLVSGIWYLISHISYPISCIVHRIHVLESFL